jgi:hypothetical protein
MDLEFRYIDRNLVVLISFPRKLESLGGGASYIMASQ